MKIAMLSDFHLGYERFREDAYRQAEEALGMAAERADVILIPGDIFDSREPGPDVLAEAITLFRNLSRREWGAKVVMFRGEGSHFTSVPIVAIPGTHERRAEGVEDPVDLLGLAGLLVDATNAQVVIQKGNDKIAIRGLGGIADDRFREILNREKPAPMDGMFNVFFFHQSLYELLPFSKDFLHVDELPKGFGLYVNGHIHSRVESKAHGSPFLISGSTVLTQLKEAEQEQKGFYIFDTKTGGYSFNRIKSRRFVLAKMQIDGKNPSDIEGEIDRLVKKEAAAGDKPVLRIEIEGTLKDGYKSLDLNAQEIAARYKDIAVVEIGKLGVESRQKGDNAGGMESSLPEGTSIKDYGMGIFVEKLRENKYELLRNPSELFDMLSADEGKDKVVKKVVDSLLE
jgi:DNA repair exonuclease SbcCD nuclease subunit